jgi:Fur family peroxide stress response transcriptional regulator
MKTDQAILIAFFKQKCRASNLKITPQRSMIYEELSKSRDHPSAVIVFRKARKIFPSISFDTVNRTLLTFSEIGVVSIVEGHGEPKRFDVNVSPHHHFRCIRCGKIFDFDYDPFDRIKTPKQIQKRFKVLSRRVVLEGVCDKCNKKK